MGKENIMQKHMLSTHVHKPTCVICKEPYFGMGHNARPVMDGRCCDDCNLRVVMMYRLQDHGESVLQVALEEDIIDWYYKHSKKGK